MSEEYLSASARRAVESAAEFARQLGSLEILPVHFLLGVVEQEESRGACLLRRFGLIKAQLLQQAGADTGTEPVGAAEPSASAGTVPLSDQSRRILSNVRGRAIERGPADPAGTEILLGELLAINDICQLIHRSGANPSTLDAELKQNLESPPLATEFKNLQWSTGHDPDASPPADQAPAQLTPIEFPQPPLQQRDHYRILDACANRAREGLRVLEDYTRFAADNPLLASELKTIRHDLTTLVRTLPPLELLAARDSEHDVGTTYSTETEWTRSEAIDVVTANLKRVQESLRSLEEFGKMDSRQFAESIKAMRYRLYTMERAMIAGREQAALLQNAQLYVLIGSDDCPNGLEVTVEQVLSGGAQVIQLREKAKTDRELVAAGQLVRRLTHQAGALFIMNDRPDIARIVAADGVHVGQTELTVHDARRIVGPGAIVGVSTHSIEQARQAVLDGANYIGVGPTFPSGTKTFHEFPGVGLIRQVHREIRLPAFAIGGINLENIPLVMEAGANRIAVSGAVCRAIDPRGAAQTLLEIVTHGAG